MRRPIALLLLAAAPLRGEPPTSLEMGDEFPAPVLSTETAPAEAARPPLKIVHPPEGAALPAVRSSFVYGWADPEGRLTVNGQPVPIHAGGGWLAMVPYDPGPFAIQAELRSPTTSYVTIRRVTVGGGNGKGGSRQVSALEPDQDLTLLPGDPVVVRASGAPGLEGFFQVEGLKQRFPLLPVNDGGIYRGVFLVPDSPALHSAAVRVSLGSSKGNRATKEAPGRVTRLDEAVPWVVEVSTSLGILRSGPAPSRADKGGYILFPPEGTRLWVTGRAGDELRVRLSPGRDAWIGAGDVRDLPRGTPPPRTTVNSITVDAAGRHTRLRVGLGQRVPFEVRPMEEGTIDVLLFGGSGNTDWVHYRDPGGAVERVEWFQDATDVYRLRVHARPGRWWGYDARYENGFFVLELRRPPPAVAGAPPMTGLRVVVDPGHSADRGAIGPTELMEKDANWAIAQCLERKLKAEGAEVVFTRRGPEDVPLYARPRRAWAAEGDVLLSVHNNALPEGANPFDRNGYGVYYFQPQAFGLAREVHRAYGEVFGQTRNFRATRLRDDGLHYGNLALPRTTQMPSVLTESAYIIVPEEEALLKTATFQCDCAEAMVRGLRRFLASVRRPR